MKRIWICGRSGSGKSTLAERLSAILNIPCIHLDLYRFDSNNKKLSLDTFLMNLSFVSDLNSFIVEGNDYFKLDYDLIHIDTIIALDMGADCCIQNVYNRRNKLRIGFPNNFNESEESWQQFIAYIKNYKPPYNLEALKNSHPQLTIIELTNYNELENMLLQIKEGN